MPRWLHRTTKNLLPSVASADLPEVQSNYIEEPDLSAVTGVEVKYWKITGDVINEMTQAEKDTVDLADRTALRDGIAAELDQLEGIMRAFALTLLDELNLHAAKITAILAAAENANNLASFKTAMNAITDMPQRTIGQLKNALRGKLGT